MIDQEIPDQSLQLSFYRQRKYHLHLQSGRFVPPAAETAVIYHTGHQPAYPQPSDLFLHPGKGRSYAPCCIGVYQYAWMCASSYQAFTGTEK